MWGRIRLCLWIHLLTEMISWLFFSGSFGMFFLPAFPSSTRIIFMILAFFGIAGCKRNMNGDASSLKMHKEGELLVHGQILMCCCLELWPHAMQLMRAWLHERLWWFYVHCLWKLLQTSENEQKISSFIFFRFCKIHGTTKKVCPS